MSCANVVRRDEGREGSISSSSTASQGTGLAQLGECSWSSLSPIWSAWRRSREYLSRWDSSGPLAPLELGTVGS